MIYNTKYDEVSDELNIFLKIPRTQSGEYTYGEGTYIVDNVMVCIDKKYCDYTLNHVIYLDYKDSLQSGNPILHFHSEQEAVKFAEDYKLMVQYSGHQD